MQLRKKKLCHLCKVFTETSIKYNNKNTCVSCIHKLFPDLNKPAEKTKRKPKFYVKQSPY